MQLALILLNAFFAATEIAIISLNEKKVKQRADDGDKKAKKMYNIIKDPTKFLSTIQIGITLAGFLGSAFAADNFAERLSGWIVRTFTISQSAVSVINTVSVVVITLILSYFTLVLGELVPKRLGMKHKDKLANAVCGIISAITVILKPVIWFLTVSTNGVLRLFGINPHEKDQSVSEEDIVLMLDAGADEGTLDKSDIKYIKNVFKLDGLFAKDVLTPRIKLVGLPDNSTEEQILSVIEDEEYSRIPVYSKTIDNIVGMLFARDYLLNYRKPGFELQSVIAPAVFVSENKRLDLLFKEMQQNRTHMVVVVDEYGMTCGIVTMEDILEELVGEIFDESDDQEELIFKNDDGSYSVKTSIELEKFFEYFNLKVSDCDCTTLNGWLTNMNEAIPQVGYNIVYEDLTITVTVANKSKTIEARVVKGAKN